MLKETFSDDEIIVSDVDEDALNKHINSNDASVISEIIQDALVDMGIDCVVNGNRYRGRPCVL